ncbi:hypothetical protein [uncultured Roseobacter sp.]|uniref:hypothetical protein n=1 Tax=uncultured Roseobacter sp. TaxID=114847 RepID=UPI00260F496F|nr:hypothetical protein [uncultured Roseobacter sp.]
MKNSAIAFCIFSVISSSGIASEYKGFAVPDDAVFLTCEGKLQSNWDGQYDIINIYVLDLLQSRYLAHRASPSPKLPNGWRKIDRISSSLVVLTMHTGKRVSSDCNRCDYGVQDWESTIDRNSLEYRFRVSESYFNYDADKFVLTEWTEINGNCQLFTPQDQKF